MGTARTYRLTPIRRLGNFWMRMFILLGVAPHHYYLLHVRGRRSGRSYSTPVRVIEDGVRYLVSPYGQVAWVKNLRATSTARLSRGVQSVTVKVVEVGPDEAAPVLKAYTTQVPITRPFFGIPYTASLGEFAAEASQHPVFRLVEKR